jgi:inorganic pyrophosphatase
MADYLSLAIGDASPQIVTTVIEIPRGSSNKYEYDKERQVFRLDRACFINRFGLKLETSA